MRVSAFILYVFIFCAHAAKTEPRIIGGAPAKDGQFPFAASFYKQTNGGTFFCAGSLINNQWILTAGQCVSDGVLFTIRLGSNSLSSDDPNAVRISTDSYVLHPNFDPTTLNNDIGLIQLRLPITFTNYIKPVSRVISIRLPDDSIVIALGWGQTNDQEAGTVDHLNYVTIRSLSNDDCRRIYGDERITDNMVCVIGDLNQGTCRGDHGSALLQFTRVSTVTYSAGVSSFISTNGCGSPEPSGFTRVSPYVEWINSVT